MKGNQAVIRATKFRGLVAQYLAYGQPGNFLILSTAIDDQDGNGIAA